MRSGRPLLSLCAVALAAALCGASAAAAASPPAADLLRPGVPGRLSDERTLTRWTTAVWRAAVHRRPDRRSDRVARLRLETESGFPEVYVGLRHVADRSGRLWARVRIPGRPNGRTGWVPRRALNAWRRSRDLLRVDVRTRHASLWRAGRRIWRSRVGVGAPGTPTPTGRFYVRERIRNLAGNPVYGPIAFGTSAYSRLSDWPGGGVIGLHGTDQPWLLPGRVSHGCVRIPNPAIRRLSRLLRVGVPVRITASRP